MGGHAKLYLLLDTASYYPAHGRILMPETGNKETDPFTDPESFVRGGPFLTSFFY